MLGSRYFFLVTPVSICLCGVASSHDHATASVLVLVLVPVPVPGTRTVGEGYCKIVMPQSATEYAVRSLRV